MLCAPALAHAGDSDDTVFLKNGGRVRGTVLVEDPAKGVTLKLADGTSRTVPAAEVKNVEYAAAAGASTAAPAPAPASVGYAPAPAPAPAATAPQPAPVAVAPTEPAEPPYHRRTGLFVTGIILVSAGAVFAGTGAALAVAGDYSDNGCTYDSSGNRYGCGHDNDTMQNVGRALGVTGGLMIAAGIPLFIVGLIKVKDEPNAASGQITLIPNRVALTPVATQNTWGLQLSGNL